MDLNKLITEITPDKLLVLWYNDEYLQTIYKDKETGKLKIYYDVYHSMPFDVKKINADRVTKAEITDIENWYIYRKQDIKEKLNRSLENPESNASMISEEIKQLKYKICKEIHSIPGYCGLLVGAISTDEDYYYLLLDENMKIKRLTCCCGIEEVHDIPDAMKHLLECTEEQILKAVEIQLSNDEVLFA